jgi:hypothetical protein
MNPSKTVALVSPTFYGGLSKEELLPYFQSQFPGNAEGCGPFAIAMAANLCSRTHQGSNFKGVDVQTILERKGLKIHGLGMPTWLGYGRSLGHFAQGRVEYKSKASIDDLEQAISKEKIVVVAVAWQTTREILRDIRHATVGHYMVAVGFDPRGARIFFLNPGLDLMEGSSYLFSMRYQKFNKYWNGIGNIFVRAGSMWTITPAMK